MHRGQPPFPHTAEEPAGAGGTWSSTAPGAEYVRGVAHTNRVESFWSMLKRVHEGMCHRMSPKHLDPYETEFEGRHNMREHDTINQWAWLCSVWTTNDSSTTT